MCRSRTVISTQVVGRTHRHVKSVIIKKVITSFFSIQSSISPWPPIRLCTTKGTKSSGNGPRHTMRRPSFIAGRLEKKKRNVIIYFTNFRTASSSTLHYYR